MTGPTETGAQHPDQPPSFGDAAGETPEETEVEAPLPGASAPAEPEDAPTVSPTVSPTADPTSDALEDDEGPSADDQLLVMTADLQRLQAEFLNYKRRVERDRGLTAENATYKVLQPIIEVLDTIDRAREHGELEGGFKSVADQLERVVTGLGLTKFGAPGDAFDPTIHEALSHIGEDPDVEVTTAKVVAKYGYKINDRVVRAAQVLVVDPVTPTA